MYLIDAAQRHLSKGELRFSVISILHLSACLLKYLQHSISMCAHAYSPVLQRDFLH